MIGLIFLLSLILIVTVHEFGHYILARSFNVGISTFSIGLGRPIVAYTLKKEGTQLQIGIFPFGGYVKFAEQPMPNKVMYTNLGACKKILILFAGPAFNFIMAFVLLFGLLQTPNYQLRPLITLANGDTARIVRVNQEPVSTWTEVAEIFQAKQKINKIELLNLKSGNQRFYSIESTKMDEHLHQWLEKQGFKIFYPQLPAIIGGFAANSPALAAGMRINDSIMAINREPIQNIEELVHCLKKYPNAAVDVTFLRNGERRMVKVKLSSIFIGKQKTGVLGIKTYELSAFPQWYQKVEYSFGQAIKHGFLGVTKILGLQTHDWINMDKNLKSLTGPIGIAYAAHQAWSMSLKSYFLFLVWLNLGVGVMNLLPLPILDGGQALMVLIEAIFPHLLKEKHKHALFIFSLIALVSLMALGFHNDWLFLQ